MRRVLIIPGGKIEEFKQIAIDNDIVEIIEGIPSGLKDLYDNSELPVIHTEESELQPQPTEVALLKEQLQIQEQAIAELTTYMFGLGV